MDCGNASGSQRHLQFTDKCVEERTVPSGRVFKHCTRELAQPILIPSNKEVQKHQTPSEELGTKVTLDCGRRLHNILDQVSYVRCSRNGVFRALGVSFGGELWSCELLSRKTRLLGDPKSLSISRPSSGSSMPATLRKLPYISRQNGHVRIMFFIINIIYESLESGVAG